MCLRKSGANLSVFMIPIYAGIFYVVLKWLKVDSFRVKRSIVLAATLAVIELVCNLIVFTLELDGIANTNLSVGIFANCGVRTAEISV